LGLLVIQRIERKDSMIEAVKIRIDYF